MAFKFGDRVKVTTATVGTGTITLGAPVSRFQSFTNAFYADGDTCHYVIEDGNNWEIGTGLYNAGTLARTWMSSSTGGLLALSGNATVMVDLIAEDFIATQIGALPDMAAGTAMLFWQATPPVGWSRPNNAAYHDKALRIVGSGAAVTISGTVAFSACLGAADTATDAFVVTANEMMPHAHTMSDVSGNASVGHTHTYNRIDGTAVNYIHSGTKSPSAGLAAALASATISAGHTHTWTGASAGPNVLGGSHFHGFDLRVYYLDVVLANRDAPAASLKMVNRAKVATATVGTGTITLGAAITSFRTFAAAGLVDGNSVRYVIEDGANWEYGIGVIGGSVTTMTRTLSASSTGSLIALSGTAQVRVDVAAEDFNPAQFNAMPSMVGAKMLWLQCVPPAGWSQYFGYNDYALRIVNGAPGTGGFVGFTTAFGPSPTASALADLPSHTHSFSDTTNAQSANHTHNYQHSTDPTAGGDTNLTNPRNNPASEVSAASAVRSANPVHAVSATTPAQGGDVWHTHTANTSVQYVDVTIATKDP